MNPNTALVASPRVELLYKVSLTIKGLLGAFQLLGAFTLFVLPNGALAAYALAFARRVISRDSDDLLATSLLSWGHNFGAAAENFYMIYLFGHGILNFCVVIALLLNIRGAYHASVAALVGFVAYQLWHYAHTYDPVLLVLTAIDILVIYLVIAERHGRTAKMST